jgi:uncharacterized membrane protein (DUF4010 family)
VGANNNLHLLVRLAVALAIGLLIGLERGWERRELPEGQRAAGFRTFGIIGLLGGVAAVVGGGTAWLPAVLAVAVSLFVALGYWRERWREQDVSITGLVAALLTFCLGALAGEGELTAASSTAVVVTLLLGFKPELHEIIRRIERSELLATLRLLLISVVLLPVLPDRGFGPWQAINPYRIWWMVVLVALISYIGYFAIKTLGERRGVLFTGLFGGLVSSTAVTVSLARHAHDEPPAPGLLTAGIAAASAMMFPRMLLIIGFVWLPLATALAWPLLLASVLTFAVAAWFSRHADSEKHGGGGERELSNPLDLKIALQFGALLALVMLLARGADAWMGSQGLYLLAAIAGLADVDAMSLSCAAMGSQGHLALDAAAAATLIAAAVNTLIKPLIALALGSRQMGWRVALAVVAAVVGGGAGLWAFAFAC